MKGRWGFSLIWTHRLGVFRAQAGGGVFIELSTYMLEISLDKHNQVSPTCTQPSRLCSITSDRTTTNLSMSRIA